MEMSNSKPSVTFDEEKVVTIDIKTKLAIAKNVIHACVNDGEREKSIPSSNICAKVQYLTGITEEVALKVVNGTSALFADKNFRDWYDECEFDPSEIQKQFSSCLRGIVVDHYVYKKNIPTLSSLLQYFGNKFEAAELKKRIRRAGYLWKGVPGTTKAILVENMEQSCEREKYLEAIKKYRENKWHISYLDEKFFNENGEIIDYVNPEEDTVTWLGVAFSAQLGFIYFAKKISISDFQSIYEEWIGYLVRTTGSRCVFVFEEKPHHEKSLMTTPTINSSAEEMLKWLLFYKIPHDSNWHRAELFRLISMSKKHFPNKIYKVDELLGHNEHRILRRPRNCIEFDFFQPLWTQLKKKHFNINNLGTEIATILTREKSRNLAELETLLIKEEIKAYKKDIEVENAIDKLLTLAKYDSSSRTLFEHCDDHIDETKLLNIIQI